jgi:L-lactate dehydrogenase complex protein LldG
MSDAARDQVLAAIRRALGPGNARPAPAAAAARPARASGLLDVEGLIELFCERVRAYGAGADRVPSSDVTAAIASAAARHAARRLVVPPAFPATWRPAELELIDDAGLGPRELERFDGALTGSAAAIAQTGTIVLDGGEEQGRRALTLLPDLHICVVQAMRIVDDVPDAIAALDETVRAHQRPVTLISGPSATGDIELRRVKGVHGPRRLEVVVVG